MKLLLTLIAALFFTIMPAWAEECSRYYCFSVHWVTVDPAGVEGINVHARDKEDATPLHWAALFSEAKIVKVLLKAGADVNVQRKDGYTPLHLAATYNGNPAMVEVLLKAGANAKIKNSDGKTAFDLIK